MDTVKFLLYFSDFIVPFTMFYIVVYGFFNRNDVYESFLKGDVYKRQSSGRNLGFS